VPVSLSSTVIIASLAAAPAVTAAPTVPSAPAAIVAAHSVAKPIEGIRINVPQSARYVGTERFALYGVADAEIHLFVQADAAKRVRKLYWIQFEGYLPTRPDGRYPYGEIDRREKLWGKTIWVSVNPVDTSTTPRAGGDRESVMRLLKRAGYTLPREMVNARLVRLLDDPKDTGYGRKELMIIYSEDLAPTGKRLSELLRDDKPTPAFAPLGQALVERAAKAVAVTFP
jgi:hypothetical protein